MMNGPRRRRRNGIEAHGDPSRITPKLSETHGDPRRTTPKQSETYGAPRPPLRYRSDSGGDYYLPNKHSIQINSHL